MTARAPNPKNTAVKNAFLAFFGADDLPEILDTWAKLTVAIRLQKDAFGRRVFEAFCGAGRACGHFRVLELVKLLTQRAERPEYEGGRALPANSVRPLLIGAGPAGLRTGIELLLLGAPRVNLVEKRAKLSRNNVLHLWSHTIADLQSLGAKFFERSFCSGGISHISTRKLQGTMIKAFLAFGGTFVASTELVGWVSPTGTSGEEAWWTATTKPETGLKFNFLLGGDGERSVVAQRGEFESTVFSAALALAITANFANTRTTAEAGVPEINVSTVYAPKLFNRIKDQASLDLENLVYFRDETHYLVTCISKASLLAAGVLKADLPDRSALVGPDNVDREALRAVVLGLRDQVGIPKTCKFTSFAGREDMWLFDFTRKRASKSAAKIFLPLEDGARPALIALAGDALIAPFWPQGTGANRAILAALDTAWTVVAFARTKLSGPDREVDLTAVLQERARTYKAMRSARSGENLVEKVCIGAPSDGKVLFSYDPATRYTGLRTMDVNMLHTLHPDSLQGNEPVNNPANPRVSFEANTLYPVPLNRRTGP